jgi:DUF4097 and DUF4098 domain-containing protein YvlB
MKTTNNPLVLSIVALITFLFSLGCSDTVVNPQVNVEGPGLISDSKAKAKESFSRNINVTSQTSLKLAGINGTISIESASATNQVSILIEKLVFADTYPDAEVHLNNITIKIEEFTDEILVNTLQPQYSNGRSYVVNYTLIVPSHISLFINNTNGEINGRVSVPLNGTIDMNLINGNIALDIPQNTSASFSASLANGSISNKNLSLHNKVSNSKSLHGILGEGQGLISLKTTNGNIGVSGF